MVEWKMNTTTQSTSLCSGGALPAEVQPRALLLVRFAFLMLVLIFDIECNINHKYERVPVNFIKN